jgi:hypothetical protein
VQRYDGPLLLVARDADAIADALTQAATTAERPAAPEMASM